MITKTEETTPSAPAATKHRLFYDSADGRIKAIDSTGNVIILQPTGLRDTNQIMNGGFQIQQRVATAATAIAGVSTTTRAGVVADRWAVTVGNATTPSWAQIDSSAGRETGLNARYYGKIIQATNASKHLLSQFIINRECQDLAGLTVRIQAKVKQFVGSNQVVKLGLLQLNSSGTVDVCPQFISAIGADTVDPTWGSNLQLIVPNSTGLDNATVSGNWLAVTTSANWQRFSGTFTIPSSAKNLMIVLMKDTAGGATDAIGYAEVGMYAGNEIRDWYEEPFTQQLIKCQAYYCKTFAYGTPPATNNGINTGEAKGICGIAAAALGGRIFWRFPTKMWKTPVTVTGYNPAAANAQIRGIVQAADYSTTTFTAQTDESVSISSTSAASSTVGQDIGLHITADAETVN